MALRASLMAQATTAIAPLQDAADLGMATGRKAPSLLSGNAIECLLLRVDEQKGFPKKVDWPTHLNSPPSAGFYVYETGGSDAHPIQEQPCMKTKQQWSRWVSVPAGSFLWADLERMGGYGHPVLCCFADWASAEVLAPGAGMVDRTGCAMNPGTKIVGGVALLRLGPWRSFPQLQDFLGRWEGERQNVVYADKLAGGLPTVCKGITKHTSPDPGCWRLLVAGTLCRG